MCVCVCVYLQTHSCGGGRGVLLDGHAVWRSAVRHLVQ